MIRRLRCSWRGHLLTEHVMEFIDTPSTANKPGPWIPISAELLEHSLPISFWYSLRCRCGKATDPTIRYLFGDVFPEDVA